MFLIKDLSVLRFFKGEGVFKNLCILCKLKFVWIVKVTFLLERVIFFKMFFKFFVYCKEEEDIIRL